ncbi:MAG: PH domain-containing protein [Coriobacteriales bacterium]|jgi:putative membrane protein|nr:PH domain-containing protein [Coriobacteriales bacterium]
MSREPQPGQQQPGHQQFAPPQAGTGQPQFAPPSGQQASPPQPGQQQFAPPQAGPPPGPPGPQRSQGGISPGPHHIHPAFVVLTALRMLFAIVLIAFFSLMGGLSPLLRELADDPDLLGPVIIGSGAFLVVFIALIAIYCLFYYKRFLWELTESDIHIYSGIVFKKQVHIPFQRVQSIDFHAGIFDRILGLVKLKIETAGGAANKGVLIPALKLGQAEAFRVEVFARKHSLKQAQSAQAAARMARPDSAQAVAMTGTVGAAGAAAPSFAPPTGAPVSVQAPSVADAVVSDIGDSAAALRGIFAEEYQENAPVEYEYGLKAHELILAALSNDQILVFFALLAGIVAQLGNMLFSLSDTLGFGYATDALFDYAFDQTFAKGAFATILISGLVIFVLTLVLSVINSAFSYGGFKARRRGGRIEVERGLLSRQYKGVAVDRVQSVELRQGFIRRLLGYAELRLLTVDSVDPNSSSQNNNKALQAGGLVVHPFVKLKRAEEILKGLAPEFNGRPAEAEYQKLPRRSFRRAIVRRALIPGLVYVLGAAALTFILSLVFDDSEPIAQTFLIALWVLAAILCVVCLIDSILWYRHAAFAYNPTMLAIRKGSYGMTTSIIPRKKIQWVAAQQNPLQRLSQVSTLSAMTAAGVSGTSTNLRDVATTDADKFIEWIRPRIKARHSAS